MKQLIYVLKSVWMNRHQIANDTHLWGIQLAELWGNWRRKEKNSDSEKRDMYNNCIWLVPVAVQGVNRFQFKTG